MQEPSEMENRACAERAIGILRHLDKNDSKLEICYVYNTKKF